MLFLPPTSGQNRASTVWKAAFDYLMPQRFLLQFYKSILAITKKDLFNKQLKIGEDKVIKFESRNVPQQDIS